MEAPRDTRPWGRRGRGADKLELIDEVSGAEEHEMFFLSHSKKCIAKLKCRDAEEDVPGSEAAAETLS